MATSFEELFQGWLEKEEYNKNKGFLQRSKIWRKYFCVLRRYDGDSNVYLQWFEREVDWRREFPVGSFGLFPKYSVYKHKNEKGKNYFEISNDEEAHYLMAANEKTMDLWVIQLMMQTRLSSSMVETSFRVKGGDNKCLQRIGAKNLNCLLHLSEWGITLALERTHSILSQWPLTTIRNYECTDNNEFVFEAGRKSPMGEGKYIFITTNSEDNLIFDQIDHYTSLRARRVRSGGGRNRLNSVDDQEIAQAYGHLRWSVMLTSSTLNLGVIQSLPSQPQAIVSSDRQVYNHLDHKNSMQSAGIADSYDRLDRTGSLSDRMSTTTSYSRLNCSRTLPSRSESQRSLRDFYDHLERASSFSGSPSRCDSRSRSVGSLEGANRFHHASPSPEDSYSHLSRLRLGSLPDSKHENDTNREWYDKLDKSMRNVNNGPDASLPNSPSGNDAGKECYNKLDRSMMSVRYDRLNSSQGSVSTDRDVAGNPPMHPVSTDPMTHDAFGNLKAHTPTSYQFVEAMEAQDPLLVELPPPLPVKPFFMMKDEQSPRETMPPDFQPTSPEKRPPRLSPRQKPLPPRQQPLPPTPLNEETKKWSEAIPASIAQSGQTQNGLDSPPHSSQTVENSSSHYQDIDEAKLDSVYAEPRGRLDSRSSDPELPSIPENKSKLDKSKRTTLHRSAPSLALYSVVDKKSKRSPKALEKTGSSFKLDSLFKKIGRTSKKRNDDCYEKIPRKTKKSVKTSTSSLRPLVQDDASSYIDVDGEECAQARKLMEKRESKRPLPDLPAKSALDV